MGNVAFTWLHDHIGQRISISAAKGLWVGKLIEADADSAVLKLHTDSEDTVLFTGCFMHRAEAGPTPASTHAPSGMSGNKPQAAQTHVPTAPYVEGLSRFIRDKKDMPDIARKLQKILDDAVGLPWTEDTKVSLEAAANRVLQHAQQEGRTNSRYQLAQPRTEVRSVLAPWAAPRLLLKVLLVSQDAERPAADPPCRQEPTDSK